MTMKKINSVISNTPIYFMRRTGVLRSAFEMMFPIANVISNGDVKEFRDSYSDLTVHDAKSLSSFEDA